MNYKFNDLIIMTFTQTISRLQLLHKLIKAKATGSPEQLAKQLGVSRSYLYVLLEELKEMNLDVSYSRKNKSFFYKNDVDIELLFQIKTLGKDDLTNINAGFCTFLVPSSILDGRNLSLSPYSAGYKESCYRF